VDRIKSDENIDFSVASLIIRQLHSCVEGDARLASLLLDHEVADKNYMVTHGLNVAWLVMGTATWMGLEAEQVRDTGMGALFKDVGMLRVPDSVRMAARRLDDNERMLIEHHPIQTLDILERCGGFSQTSLIVAYQAHECCNGTGYPRGRNRMTIHPMARLTAVADIYSAVTCNRPYRNGVTPYGGMTILLDEASAGRLDPNLVRIFLDCFTLFPIGSYVGLSDGTISRVLQSNGAEHTKPVVVPLDASGSETDEEIDLSTTDRLSVVEALPTDDARRRASQGGRDANDVSDDGRGQGEHEPDAIESAVDPG